MNEPKKGKSTEPKPQGTGNTSNKKAVEIEKTKLSQLALLTEEHSGRDEMNLAGNPFALLISTNKSASTVILREFTIQNKDGKVIPASWRVSGDAELGLPGPTEEMIFLVLMQMTREYAETTGSPWEKRVPFSMYDLHSRLGWTRNKKTYQTLRNALTRLQNVSIKAENAFWDARTKSMAKSVDFHILETVFVADEPTGRKRDGVLPLSYFEWNELVFNSMMAGNVRSLALNFVLELQSSIARRLFRLLDMMRKSSKFSKRGYVELKVFDVRDRLGMSPYPYSSKVKEKLIEAHEELLTTGFLSEVSYQILRKEEWVVYRFGKMDLGGINFGPPEESQTVLAASSISPPTTTVVTKRSKTTKAADMAQLSHKVNSISIDIENASTQEIARWCSETYKELSATDQARLLERAREGIVPVFWDRLEAAESPMSLGLWNLVREEFPEEVNAMALRFLKEENNGK